jgi:hypothetical protein
LNLHKESNFKCAARCAFTFSPIQAHVNPSRPRSAGDNAGADASWHEARNELEALLPQQLDDTVLLADLAPVAAAQKDKAAALTFTERVTGLVPSRKTC